MTATKLSVGGPTTITMQTGDIALVSANVVSHGKVEISAASDLTITSAQDTSRNSNQNDNNAIGKVVISDTERFAGYHNDKHKDDSSEMSQVASNVAGLVGDVMLTAGEKYTQVFSNFLAGNDVSITAESIDITAVGSTIHGGNNVSLTSTAGDIHATRASLGAGKTLSLDSARDIVLDASQSTAHADGKKHSAGAEVGVGFQADVQGTGVYASASANVGNGHNESDRTTCTNTQLKADTLNITSKGDTTLRAAMATASTLNADVGGKRSIESLRDISEQESSQTNVGGGVQISFSSAWSASSNVSQSNTNGSSAAVGQQSRLFAGDGGYHVKADTVALKGGDRQYQ